MKKRKVSKSHKAHSGHRTNNRSDYSLGGGKKLICGLEQDFVLIVGGSFVLVIFGIILFF